MAALKASFDFCSQALTNLQDSKMDDTVKFFIPCKNSRRFMNFLFDPVVEFDTSLHAWVTPKLLAPGQRALGPRRRSWPLALYCTPKVRHGGGQEMGDTYRP